MGPPQRVSPPRASVLRFGLVSVSLTGSPTNFSSPQLVFKTQNSVASRIPYTGSQSRRPLRRHFLMVHVRDRAKELETLDLASFISHPESPSSAHRHNIESIPSEYALVFHYLKGDKKDQCILKATFQKAADFEASLAKLKSLGVVVQTQITPYDGSTGSSQQESLESSTQSSVFDLAISGTTLGRNGSWSLPLTDDYLGNSTYRTAPVRPANSAVPFLASQQPVNRLTRAATIGEAPGMAGGGLYRIERVGSAPRPRVSFRRTPGTVINSSVTRAAPPYFDEAIGSGDALSYAAADHEQPESLSQDSFFDRVADADTNTITQFQGRSSRSLSSVGSAPPRLIHPRLRQLSLNQGSSSLEPISEASHTLAANYRLSRDLAQKTQEREISGGSSQSVVRLGLDHGIEKPQHPSEQLLRSIRFNHEGLHEATKIWDEFIQRGGKAAKMSRDEADRFLLRCAEEYQKQVDELAAETMRRIQGL